MTDQHRLSELAGRLGSTATAAKEAEATRSHLATEIRSQFDAVAKLLSRRRDKLLADFESTISKEVN